MAKKVPFACRDVGRCGSLWGVSLPHRLTFNASRYPAVGNSYWGKGSQRRAGAGMLVQ